MANIDINGYTPYFQDFGSISQKEYHQMVKRLQESPDDIVAIGDVAIFLLGYIFSETISNYT